MNTNAALTAWQNAPWSRQFTRQNIADACAQLVNPEISKYRDRRFEGNQEDFERTLRESTTVYVGNLSFFTTEEQIYEVCLNLLWPTLLSCAQSKAKFATQPKCDRSRDVAYLCAT